MTGPLYDENSYQDPTAPPPFPPPYLPPAVPPPAGYGQSLVPQAGYPPFAAAIDPATGQPLSDKSKLAAGLLQLLVGGLTGIAGIGRLYAGNIGIGVAQLILSIIGWITAVCLGWLLVPLIVPIASWLWVVIDGVVILAGRPVDGQGRLLRS